jgi:cyclophilin family peptidyl-prolyl cis-trans isomerase
VQMKRLALLAAMVAVALAGGVACQMRNEPARPKQWSTPPGMRIDANKTYTARITTTMGDLSVNLLAKEAPTTVNNFVFLAREGFYDGVKFHRVIKGFMVQTGDPKGDGTGGPGYTFVDEPVASNYDRGVLAMANRGPNTNGSQFFIVHGDEVNLRLPKNYTIFGKVTQGVEVVDQIASVPVGSSPTGEMSIPQTEVRITKVAIEER